MSTENIQTPTVEKPTIAMLWQDVKKYKRLYYKVLGITFVVAAILLLGTPNYYRCTVMLAPELSSNNRSGSLASIASSFGIKLGGANGSEALFPTLYPDLMNSVAFRTSLFPIKIQPKDADSTMTYYDYLENAQKPSLISYVFMPLQWATTAIASLAGAEEKEEPDSVNPFMLTKKQFKIAEIVGKKVVCDVDNKTLVITIDVTDQDALVAATLADSVQRHLQDFITDYRTRKARVDLAYNQKLYREAKERYEAARIRSAAYNDANQHVFLDKIRSERVKLENEMQLQYSAYSQIAAQLQLAEAKVQEETPAFTMLQPATVPIKKDGPKRTKMMLVLLFIAFLATSAYAIHKEGHLIPLFASDDDEEE